MLDFAKYKISVERGIKKNFLEKKIYAYIENLELDVKPHEVFEKGDLLIKKLIGDFKRCGILFNIGDNLLMIGVLLDNGFVFVNSRDGKMLFWRELDSVKKGVKS